MNPTDDEYCKNQCDEASLACLQDLHEHVIEYLDRHSRIIQNEESSTHEMKQESYRNANGSSNRSINSNSSSSCCSYEDWIRECHPENTNFDDDNDSINSSNQGNDNANGSTESLHHHGVDFRFYLKESDHRIIWNGYVLAYGLPQLKVDCQHNHKYKSRQRENEEKTQN